MTEDRWNPMPNNRSLPASKQTPRERGEQVWRLTQGARLASCELRDDTAADAGWEVRIRHDDELIVGLRCENETMARYYANAFRQDYARTGWTEASR
jgi:hypothetical protein